MILTTHACHGAQVTALRSQNKPPQDVCADIQTANEDSPCKPGFLDIRKPQFKSM